jgi:hypothetical protein
MDELPATGKEVQRNRCKLNLQGSDIVLWQHKSMRKTHGMKEHVSGFTMLDAPVPIRSLKLSNIGPE